MKTKVKGELQCKLDLLLMFLIWLNSSAITEKRSKTDCKKKLDLDRALSEFLEVEDFSLYIDIVHKYALVRERKVDWGNLLVG